MSGKKKNSASNASASASVSESGASAGGGSCTFEKKTSPRVFVGTWNVNELSNDADLNEWLDDESPGAKADIYAIGFQECDNTISSHFTLSANHVIEKIDVQLLKYFGEPKTSKYQLLVSERLDALYSVVYVRKALLPQISAVATAFYKLAPTKGITALRFRYRSTSMAFINAHLTAHTHLKDTRDAEFVQVVFNLSFDWIPHTHMKSDMYDIKLNKHDIIFWSGDLNYRVDCSLEEALKMLRPKGSKEHAMNDAKKSLLKYDQLKAFVNFKEMEINFEPSYKYVNDSVYDFKASPPYRTPSWTDRVLWKVKEGRGVSVTGVSYRSYPNYTVSDHKPVSATFVVDMTKADPVAILDIIPSVVTMQNQGDGKGGGSDKKELERIEAEHEKYGHYFGDSAWKERNPRPPCSHNVTFQSVVALLSLVVVFIGIVIRS
eukprot:Nk52_evm49s224 gene=Nk52_evmTU49s224